MRRQQTTNRLCSIGAWMSLLVYLFSATPLLPVATALVAWADGEHRVTLSAGRDGTQIVLGHDARDARTAPTHSHCAVSQVLTLLAGPAGPVHSDHILNFHNAGFTTLRDEALRTVPPLFEQGLDVPKVTATVASVSPVAIVEAPLLDIPPPDIAVVVARATVFLI